MKTIKLLLVSTCVILMTAFSTLSLAETSTQYVKSSAITADVKAKLLADSDVSSLHITVKTIRDKVILKGYVETKDQKAKAVAIASQTDGVKSVKDELIVKKVKK